MINTATGQFSAQIQDILKLLAVEYLILRHLIHFHQKNRNNVTEKELDDRLVISNKRPYI